MSSCFSGPSVVVSLPLFGNFEVLRSNLLRTYFILMFLNFNSFILIPKFFSDLVAQQAFRPILLSTTFDQTHKSECLKRHTSHASCNKATTTKKQKMRSKKKELKLSWFINKKIIYRENCKLCYRESSYDLNVCVLPNFMLKLNP